MLYYLKINIALAVFYIFYRLMFEKDTFLVWRRFLLMFFPIIAIIFPLISIQKFIEPESYIAGLSGFYSQILPEIEVKAEQVGINWGEIARQSLYFVIAAGWIALSVRFVYKFLFLINLALKCHKTNINDTEVCLLPSYSGPFSFFNNIFIYPKAHSENELEEILLHEKAHVAQYHTIDVLIAEIVTIICWINPFAWLLKREVRDNLEYLADRKVLLSGIDSKSYQYHLLGLSYNKAAANLYNSFNVLSVKNRIIMMNKKPSKRIEKAKRLLLLPLIGFMLLFSYCNSPQSKQNVTSDEASKTKVKAFVVDDSGIIMGATVVIKGTNNGAISDSNGEFIIEASTDDTLSIGFPSFQSREIAVKDIQDGMNFRLENIPVKDTYAGITVTEKNRQENRKVENTTEGSNKVFTVVDEMPEFPGGLDGLLKFISKEIKYPVEAQKKGIQGRVILAMVVDKEGSINNVEVLRGVDPLLDKEAIRVIESMPKWKPGKHDGQVVNVRYTIPVLFKLQ